MKTRLIQCLLATFALSLVFASDTPTKPEELKVSVLRYSAERRAVVVRFENHSRKPLRLLRPIDGSEWGWRMPIYDVSITDSTGKVIPLESRCGNTGLYSDMTWPDDYRVQILPGDAYEMSVMVARELPLAGIYSFQFRYTYEPATKTTKQDSSIKYPDDLWVGSATSAPLDIDIPNQKIAPAEKAPVVSTTPLTPLEVWAAMKERVKAGDFNEASSFFVAKRREAYREMFKKMGKVQAYQMVSGFTEYKVWMLNEEIAGYTAKCKTDDAESPGFPLNFEKENGVWKILEF